MSNRPHLLRPRIPSGDNQHYDMQQDTGLTRDYLSIPQKPFHRDELSEDSPLLVPECFSFFVSALAARIANISEITSDSFNIANIVHAPVKHNNNNCRKPGAPEAAPRGKNMTFLLRVMMAYEPPPPSHRAHCPWPVAPIRRRQRWRLVLFG